MAMQSIAPTHRAILNGKSILFNIDDSAALGSFVATGGNPADLKVEVIEPADLVKVKQVAAAGGLTLVEAPAAAPAEELQIGEYDAVGDARAEQDRHAAIAAGFNPSTPIYRQGSRATGMQVHRAKFDRLPEAKDAAIALQKLVTAEQRQDVEIERQLVSLNDTGTLKVKGADLPMTERAFKSLIGRLDMPEGARTFLAGIRPAMRANNVNDWVNNETAPAEQFRKDEALRARKPYNLDYLKVRTRIDAKTSARHAFGVVTDSYTEYDADKIGRAIELAVPAGARASWKYDGTRTKFDALFFTNVEPKHAVAGEFFQAGVSIRTDDTGGGGIIVSAGIWQNLCLNFIIIDHAKQSTRISHIGSVDKLAAKFRAAFNDSLGRIEHFTKQWGYACEENTAPAAIALAVVNGTIKRDEATSWEGRPAREVLAGLFNGIVQRELVPLPRRDREKTVGDLLKMWSLDQSSATAVTPTSRAAVVNALTRYAHQVNNDPFKEHEIEAGAGQLLSSAAPLPFLPIVV